MPANGSLMVVGTGIKSVGHVTLEAQGWIAQAQKVLYCVANPVTEAWIKRLNPTAEDLSVYYGDEIKRVETYQRMAGRIMSYVRAGLDVCAVFYGHPGVFVYASHESIALARREGYRAGMAPGVSATDCLFADLGIDPSLSGCQMFDATDYLLRHRRLNTDCHVILWQIAFVGDAGFSSSGYDARNLPILVEALQGVYGEEYEVVLYQAATYPISPPLIERLPLSRLTAAKVTAFSTLYLPPRESACLDVTMAERLGLRSSPTAVQEPRQGAVRPRRSVGASRLADLLADLSQDPRLLALFMRNPDATAERYGGLTQGERAALLSGHPARIREAVRPATRKVK